MCYYVTKNRLLFTNHFKFQTNVKLIYVGTMHSAMWNKVCRSCKVVSFFHHSWFMWESGYLNFLLSVSGSRSTWRNTYRYEKRRLQNLGIFFLSIERICHILFNHMEFPTKNKWPWLFTGYKLDWRKYFWSLFWYNQSVITIAWKSLVWNSRDILCSSSWVW